MKIIVHRRNTIEALLATPQKYGIEVDIRSVADRLVIHHDPFADGESFDDWLAHYRHGTLILNVKEEGLEGRLIELMRACSISDYFFLDQSFPFLIKWARLGEKRCAVRVSEFESVETALSLAGMVEWVWIDCFTKFPLSAGDGVRLREAGFRLCLVSPELQGRTDEHQIKKMQEELADRAIAIDAVCTKRPDLWDGACAS